MKLTYYFIVFMLSCMVASGILRASGVEPVPLTPFDADTFAENMNATGIVNSYDPTQHEFYDVGAGLRYLWNMQLPIIDAPISLLQDFAVPVPLVDAFKVLWAFIKAAFVISFFSGREIAL